MQAQKHNLWASHTKPNQYHLNFLKSLWTPLFYSCEIFIDILGRLENIRTIHINLDNTGIIAFYVFFMIEWISQSWNAHASAKLSPAICLAGQLSSINLLSQLRCELSCSLFPLCCVYMFRHQFVQRFCWKFDKTYLQKSLCEVSSEATSYNVESARL